MMQQISIYLTSIILGIMLFFSFVVAPITFTALDEENARKFIRKIFPYYYIVNLAISILVLILFIILKIFSLDFYLILSVEVLFSVSNFVLMPLINKYRDEKQDKKFKKSHFVSVVINFVQMILLVIVLIKNELAIPKPTAIKIPNQIKPLIKKNAKLPSNKYLPYLFFCSSNLKFFKSFILLKFNIIVLLDWGFVPSTLFVSPPIGKIS